MSTFTRKKFIVNDSLIIEQTQKWIKSVVIDLNFCPFAAKALLKKSIHYVVVSNADLETSLETLIKEMHYLDSNEEIETTFIVFPKAYADFDEYLDLVDKEEYLLELEGY